MAVPLQTETIRQLSAQLQLEAGVADRGEMVELLPRERTVVLVVVRTVVQVLTEQELRDRRDKVTMAAEAEQVPVAEEAEPELLVRVGMAEWVPSLRSRELLHTSQAEAAVEETPAEVSQEQAATAAEDLVL